MPNVERPWVVKVPYFDVTIYAQAEDPKKHFTVKEIKGPDQGGVHRAGEAAPQGLDPLQDQALVFVHGYNTSFDNALFPAPRRSPTTSTSMERPSSTAGRRAVPSRATPTDRESAQASELYLRHFLEMVTKETGAKQ